LSISNIAVVGLGYVGLPLAVALAKHGPVTGYDHDPVRIRELQGGHDRTGEVFPEALAGAAIRLTDESAALAGHHIYIITVPTPVDRDNVPDLSAVASACHAIGEVMSAGAIVVLESTVYPGATEEIVGPALARASGMRCGTDFFLGYSPERINPGDKEHRLPSIRKVTSGSTPEVAEFVDQLYRSVVHAGTHKASSIRVAEAAKVIENTQRDVNIALINELALLFNRLGIDTEEVLLAAGSKWNFLPFRPGLVGGHCIGVDPYYLTHKAQEIGFHPEMILAGRRLNDGMANYVAGQVVKLMASRKILAKGSKVLVLGLTFKENCPDLRNSKVADVVRELKNYGARVDVYDPWIDAEEAEHEYGIRPIRRLRDGAYDAAVMAVGHKQFRDMGIRNVRKACKEIHVVYDIKYVFPADQVDGRL
jgi:UDP-N-acetyl-D-glucosamine/UDP-N-acetyl-D-galactosamine dehydrogenase